jgi:hypothetical protein
LSAFSTDIRAQGYNYEELRFGNRSGEVLGKFLNGSKEIYNFYATRFHRTIEFATSLLTRSADGIHPETRPYIEPKSSPARSGLIRIVGMVDKGDLGEVMSRLELQ